MGGTLAGLSALAVYFLVDVRVFALNSNELLVSVETAIALTALLAAFLMAGRYRRDGVLLDGLLALALVLLAVSAGITWWLQVFGGHLPAGIGVVDLTIARLIGAIVLLLAAVLPFRWLQRNPRWAWTIGGAAGVVVAAILGHLTVAALTGWTVTIWQPGALPIAILEGLGSVAFVVAAVAFVRAGARRRDLFRTFLGAAAFAASLSRLHYFIDPSLYLSQVHLGDVFRLLAYGLLFVGAMYEVRRAWERHEADLLLVERRRIARQLHDGVAHETAYIAMAARQLLLRDPSPELADIAKAAEVAFDETRQVIHVYSQPPEEPLDRLLVSFAEQIAHRSGASLRAECDEGIRPEAEVAEALTRIVRESVTNAVRHGRADRIELHLRQQGRLQLTVQDNGAGFDGTVLSPLGGFGLLSMRERVEGLGGTFTIESEPGRGTRVEVML